MQGLALNLPEGAQVIAQVGGPCGRHPHHRRNLQGGGNSAQVRGLGCSQNIALCGAREHLLTIFPVMVRRNDSRKSESERESKQMSRNTNDKLVNIL